MIFEIVNVLFVPEVTRGAGATVAELQALQPSSLDDAEPED